MCIGGTSQWPATIFRGIDQWGERYGYILVDPIGGAIGAFSHADGISTGGQARTPICKLPNVEHTEQSFPVLVLYRKEIIGFRRRRQMARRPVGRVLLHPARHRQHHPRHAVLRQRDPDLDRHDGRLPRRREPLSFLRDTDIQERMKRSASWSGTSPS